MAHTVTIRTQTVTSNSTAIVINSGYLKTWGGAIKLLQLALGIVCVTIIGHHFTSYNYLFAAELFFLLMTTTFLIGTAILIISYLSSHSTPAIISKTIYELMYHAIAFGLYLAASLTFLVNVSNRGRGNDSLMAGAICGLVNAGLYLLSTIIAIRTYRGL
ncbi:uncharacterized protein LOC143211587 [Lasioglossum baleicum]|uniref:uncharacterized protein LOC143211587 n=1 Tax=Lasioglossum baleicum TaxID=434251 RepID=UPI003FCC7165